MKNIKKIVFLFILFLFPLNVFASDGETKDLLINIDVLDNGDISVQELASLEGDYNGRYRNIGFLNLNAPKFTGKQSDFEGSDIYNGSSITNVKVFDVPGRSNISFNDLKNKNMEFKRVTVASSGEQGVYTQEFTSDGIKLKIFNPSSTNTSFYLEYVITNVVVVHNDVAEIAWNILGDNYEDNIYNMEVHVNLPGKDTDERVWLRGPLNGEITRNNDSSGAVINYGFLGARNPVSFRIMFDKNLVSNSNKLSNVLGKEKIMAVEKIAADKANNERNRIKAINNLAIGGTIIWFISLIILFVLVLLKKKQCDKCDFNQDYLRDFPANYGPEILEYLLKKSIGPDGMSASILMIIEKKALKVEENPAKKENYTLVTNEKFIDELTKNEVKIFNLLIGTIGDGKKVTLDEIKKYGKNYSKAQKFMKDYNSWKSDSELIATKEDFFKPIFPILVFFYFICALSIPIMFLNISLETQFVLGYISVLVVIPLFIISLTFKFRTEKGTLEYKEWQALKKFMIDFGTMDEKKLPEIKLWGKYLVYASVLGCAKEVEKAMKLRIENMDTDSSYYSAYNDYYLTHAIIHSSVYSSVHSSVQGAVSSSRSSIASSSSSSGGGYGGGASFGGGSFGGGGGGGHF